MNSLKNWQIFFIIVFPLIVSELINDQFINSLFKAGFFVIVVSYFLLIGDFLNRLNNGKSNWFFVFNCFFMIIFYVLSIVEVGIANGIIVMVLSIYFGFSYIYVADELAVGIRKAEGKEVSNFKQATEFLLFFVWPIGIWFLQPRVNKL